MVGSPVGQPVDQPGIAVKGEDDRLVGGEERVEFRGRTARADARSRGCSVIRSTTLTTRIFSSGRCAAQQIDGSQRLQRRHVAGAGHHDVRLAAFVVAGPFPDADARRAVPDRPRPCRSHCSAGCLPATMTLT